MKLLDAPWAAPRNEYVTDPNITNTDPEIVTPGVSVTGKTPGKRPSIAELYDRMDSLNGEPVDYSGLSDVNKARMDTGNRNMIAGLALRSLGGKVLQQPGQELFRQSLTEQEGIRPNAADEGWINPITGKFVVNPAKERSTREKMIASRIDSLTREELAQQRQADIDQANRDRARHNEAMEKLQADRNKEAADAARAREAERLEKLKHLKLVPGVISQADGGPVYVRPEGGPHLDANAQPLKGGIIQVGPSVKQDQEQQAVAAQGKHLDSLIGDVEANPKVFGRMVGTAENDPTGLVRSGMLSPEEIGIRARVMAYGAQAVHKLYGAALTAAEKARANSWAITPFDDGPTIAAKLRGAQQDLMELEKRQKKGSGGSTSAPSTKAQSATPAVRTQGGPPPGWK